MRRYLATLGMTTGLGTLAGAAAGAARWSRAWPELSALTLAKALVIGWMIGVAVSPVFYVISRIWFKRPAALRLRNASVDGRPTTETPSAGVGTPALQRPTRVLRGTLTIVAIIPVFLALTLLQPQGLFRRALASPRAREARPNLILITIDALRTEQLGAYGSKEGLTPNLDAFAEEATCYDAAYVSSPWTLTSFASIMSSRPPSQCGLKLTTPRMHNWYLYSAKLPERVPLLSEQLQEAGYITAAELTNCFLTDERGWERGFTFFRNEDGPALGAILTRADKITRNTLAWLRLRPRQPFFLWVHYLDPHVPYNSPETPAKLRAQYPGDWLTRREYWYNSMRYRDEETKARYAEFCRKMYAEEVRYTDKCLGKLLTGIKRTGEWDRSLIVIASDHGEELFDHGEFEHGHTMHEELLRVPLLIKWPKGITADTQISQIVSMLDLAPTFIELAGSSPLPGAIGRPLPRKSGGAGEEVYSEGILHGPEQTALTMDTYKIIHRANNPLAGEIYLIYDRKVDRQERKVVDKRETDSLKVRLLAQEKEALSAARQWKVSNQQEFRGIDLSHATREKLKDLGYIGE